MNSLITFLFITHSDFFNKIIKTFIIVGDTIQNKLIYAVKIYVLFDCLDFGHTSYI